VVEYIILEKKLRNIASTVTAYLLLISIFILAFEAQSVKAVETIYIRADGLVEPETAPIQRDGDVYTFTDNIINQSIVVERDDITIDGNGFTLQGGGTGSGFNLFERNNITIKNTCIQGFTIGISIDVELGSTELNTICNNTVTENGYGIMLYTSHHSTIVGNTIVGNGEGIWMAGCGYNSIFANNITGNGKGMFMHTSYCTDVFSNIIANNSDGIYMEFSWHIGSDPSWRNIIYHNNFINNFRHIVPMYSENTWDDGYPSGGNYWSGYNVTDLYSGVFQNETGSDGIGDTPYVLDDNNQDDYPLMNLYWNPADINHDLKVDIYDIVLVCNAYGTTPSSPNWNPNCDITEPYEMINIYDVVMVVGSYGEGWEHP